MQRGAKMKAYVPDYQFERAKNLQHAVDVMSSYSHRPFAGGTDLMVLFEAGKLPTGKYLDISTLAEFKGIHIHDDRIELGALTTYSEICNHDVIKKEFPLLCEAAKLT